MGRSKSIEDMARENDKFKDFVATMRKDLDAEVDKHRELIRTSVKEHYAPYGNDDVSMLMGSFSHQSCVSEWNLDAINGMIDTCRNALLGGEKPKGTSSDEDSMGATQAIKKIAGVNELIAGAAFDAVQGLLRGVSSRTSIETKSQFATRPLAPGLTLFISVVENGYDKKHFFGTESIVQTIFVFDARYSLAEGKKQAEMTGLMALSNLLEAFAQQLAKVSLEITKVDIMDEQYDFRMDRLENISERIKTQMGKIRDEMAALGQSSEDHAEVKRLNSASIHGARALASVARSLHASPALAGVAAPRAND